MGGDFDSGKYRVVRGYITSQRKRRGIKKLGITRKPELSCEIFGEYFNLVERQLLKTKEGFGAWIELRDSDVLDGAYRYVVENSFV